MPNNKKNFLLAFCPTKVNAILDDFIQTMQPNGTILIAQNSEILLEQYFGLADQSKKISTTQRTQYLVGSITKQFTAAALLHALFQQVKNDTVNQAVERVHKALQRPVNDFLTEQHDIWAGTMPDWARNISLHQLLEHSSGLPNYTSLPHFEDRQHYTAAELIAFFKTHPLEFEPGTQFSYSNSGYFLLGVIIETITQQSLSDYLEKVFFKPLQMFSSFLATQGTVNDLKHETRFKHLARGYTFEIEQVKAKIFEEDHYTSMEIPGGAGSLISTATDLLKWNQALYSGKVLPPALLEIMLTSHIQTEKPGEYYAYGIEIKDSAFGKYYTHRGGIPGFHSLLSYIPKLQLSMIIIENIYPRWHNLRAEIEDIKASLPATIPDAEKFQQIPQILESRHPSIIENRNRYELIPLADIILVALASVLKV